MSMVVFRALWPHAEALGKSSFELWELSKTLAHTIGAHINWATVDVVVKSVESTVSIRILG